MALPGHNPTSVVGDADYDKCVYEHDAAKRLTVKTDQKGDTCTKNWDLASRLTSRDYRLAANSPSGTIADTDSFEFDDASRMTQATSGRYNNVVNLAYDDASRLSKETLTAGGQSYPIAHAYDAANRKIKCTYPDGSIVDRGYTDRNQLEDVDYTPSGGIASSVADFLYDNGMRETKRTHGNGIVTNREYNRRDNYVTKIDVPSYAGLTFDYGTAGYDANKNVLKETAGGVMAGYSWTTAGGATSAYDEEDRLTYWERTSGTINQQEWPQVSGQGLSKVCDWDSVKINGTSQSRTHDAVHQLNSIGTSSLSYDAKGNLTQDNKNRTFVWDFDNRMKSSNASSAGGSAALTFACDALGRRVSKNNGTTNMVYVCAGQQVVSEYVAGAAPTSPTQRYVYATYVDEPLLQIDSSETKHFYHTNRQYSVTALTDSTGTVQERYAYTAYGVTTILAPNGTTVRATSALDNPYMYTGRRLDKEFASGSEDTIHYYRARYYVPKLGRFLGRDPIIYGGGYNVYAYVGGGPLGRVDPSGKVLIYIDVLSEKTEGKVFAESDVVVFGTRIFEKSYCQLLCSGGLNQAADSCMTPSLKDRPSAT